MAHGHKTDEKIVYVGDSRVKVNNKQMNPQDYSAYPGKSEVFIPNFLLKEWMVAAVVLVGVLVLVMSEPAPLGNPADPTTKGFIPIPDWYFLFLYQFLKYPFASGSFVPLGTVLTPTIMFGALLLAPFLDTGKERRFYKRPVASSLMFLSIAAVVYLTAAAWEEYQHELEVQGIVPEHIKNAEEREAAKHAGVEPPSKSPNKQAAVIVAQDDVGADIYARSTCMSCHATDLKGNDGVAPTLLAIGDKHSKEDILDIIHNGYDSEEHPGSMQGQYDLNVQKGLTDDDFDKLANWLSMQKKEAPPADAE